ncbi:hypothetical protein EES47_00375 [Streptomyces sp. ADI98-12]|nr:hypothetical protein EES47_00375 [Streptomyces sp. ADI98-12]
MLVMAPASWRAAAATSSTAVNRLRRTGERGGRGSARGVRGGCAPRRGRREGPAPAARPRRAAPGHGFVGAPPRTGTDGPLVSGASSPAEPRRPAPAARPPASRPTAARPGRCSGRSRRGQTPAAVLTGCAAAGPGPPPRGGRGSRGPGRGPAPGAPACGTPPAVERSRPPVWHGAPVARPAGDGPRPVGSGAGPAGHRCSFGRRPPASAGGRPVTSTTAPSGALGCRRPCPASSPTPRAAARRLTPAVSRARSRPARAFREKPP